MSGAIWGDMIGNEIIEQAPAEANTDMNHNAIINPVYVIRQHMATVGHLFFTEAKPPSEDDYKRENFLLEKAIHFATSKHAGQLRKDTKIPYIVHPLETMNILRSMNADTNLLIAGLLHDTVEDTNTTAEEIAEIFGTDVATLVNSHSEDKSKTWEDRKTHAIKELAGASHRMKMLVMADKVSNLRSMVADYRASGDDLWKRFNAPVEKQAWYYSGIQDALWDMQLDPDAAPVYWEMVGLYKDVFVKFYHVKEFCPPDYEEECLLQICANGSIFRLDKGNPEWKQVEDSPEEIALNREELLRKDAEALEDEWNKPFWECVDRDLHTDTYEMMNTRDRSVRIKVLNRALSLSGEDYGPVCERINGKDEYEYQVALDEDNTMQLIVQLRMKYGIDLTLDGIFIEEFGRETPSSMLMEFCDTKTIQYQFISN